MGGRGREELLSEFTGGWDVLMKPPIMMNVQMVRSTALRFLGAGIVFSPCPSPGATPSSNLTLFLLGLVGVGRLLGPDGAKSLGVLRLRLAGRVFALGVGRSGRSGLNVCALVSLGSLWARGVSACAASFLEISGAGSATWPLVTGTTTSVRVSAALLAAASSLAASRASRFFADFEMGSLLESGMPFGGIRTALLPAAPHAAPLVPALLLPLLREGDPLSGRQTCFHLQTILPS